MLKFNKLYPVYIHLSMYILHYASSHFYYNICTPKSFYGFLYSYILTSSQQCHILLYIVNITNTIFNQSWLSLLTFIATLFNFNHK